MKHNNICIIRILEGEKKEQGLENLFEKVMTENFLDLVGEKVIQIQESQRVPIKMKPKRSTPRHIIIKMAKFKDKERILKAEREKELVPYKGAMTGLSADFSRETLQSRRELHEIFQVMKSKYLKPRLLYLERLSLKMKGEIRSFPETKKAKGYVSTKPALQK